MTLVKQCFVDYVFASQLYDSGKYEINLLSLYTSCNISLYIAIVVKCNTLNTLMLLKGEQHWYR